MRLQFTDWKMEGGVVTERRASCGPLHYAVVRDLTHVYGWINTIRLPAVCLGFPAAEAACESHLQAILDAAAALDAAHYAASQYAEDAARRAAAEEQPNA